MRKVAVLLVVASGVLSRPAAAQTCPPSDPLCTTNRASPSPKPKKEADLEKSADPASSPAEESPPAKPAEKPKQKEDEKPASGRGVITLAEVTITGRVQKPIAAVDVGRIAPRLTLSVLRQPFLERIEKVIYSDPF